MNIEAGAFIKEKIALRQHSSLKPERMPLKEEQKTVEAEKVKARQATSADQVELEKLRAEHKETFSKLPRTSQAAYERIRKKWNGSVIAEAAQNRCSACKIVLRPQYAQDLRRGDQLMFCESCGRILFINPPVGFDDQGPLRAAEGG